MTKVVAATTFYHRDIDDDSYGDYSYAVDQTNSISRSISELYVRCACPEVPYQVHLAAKTTCITYHSTPSN